MDKVNIYIDSNVIVAAELEEERDHKESRNFMNVILEKENKNIVAHTSIFTVVELASAMFRRTKNIDKTYSLIYRLESLWNRKASIFTVEPVLGKGEMSFNNLINALLDVVIKFSVPAADAIHAHTVAEYEMHYLVTWNKRHFVGLGEGIEDLKIMTPTEMLDEMTNIENENK